MTKTNEALRRLLHEVRSPLAAIYTAGMMIQELPEDTPLSRFQRQVNLINSSVGEARKMLEKAEELLEPTPSQRTSSTE